MLKRMLGVTRRNRLRNKEVRERTGVQENIVKVVERSKVRWYGHVVRKGERDVVRRLMVCPVMGKRNKGSQGDGVETRLKEWGVRREDALDRKRRRGIVAADPSGREEADGKEEEEDRYRYRPLYQSLNQTQV